MSADNIIKQLYLDDANAKAGKLVCQGKFGLVVEEDKDIFLAEPDLRCCQGSDGLCGQSLHQLPGQPRQLGQVEEDREGESLKIFAMKLAKRAKLSVFGPKIRVFLRNSS